MITRHANALALMGWYLMAPPLTYTANPESPSDKYASGIASHLAISRWENVGAYDRADECEKARADMVQGIAGAATAAAQGGHVSDAETRANKVVFQHWSASVCIASDDSRLKEK